MPTHPIIVLWSHPRSLSTAFERSMRERGDLRCFHEPFMYYYYLGSGRDRFPQFNADPDHPTSYQDIKAMLLEAARQGPVFVKDMSYYVSGELADDPDFNDRLTHTFLIRHPARSIASYFALDRGFSSEEVGINAIAKHVAREEQRTGVTPPIVAAEDLEADPAAMVQAYCNACRIPFNPEALTWSANTPDDWRPVLGWHQSVSASTGFQQKTRTPLDADSIEALLDGAPHLHDYFLQHFDSYARLHALRLRLTHAG